MIAAVPAALLLIQFAEVDVTSVKLGEPVTVASLDLGHLKGILRRVAWSPDDTLIYLQSADGKPPSETIHHYSIKRASGALTALKDEPEWAADYWAAKSDRFAPGLEHLEIKLEQKYENLKYGTGSAGALEGGDRAGGGTVMSGNNIDRLAGVVARRIAPRLGAERRPPRVPARLRRREPVTSIIS